MNVAPAISPTGRGSLRERALADRAGLKRRFPDVFTGRLRRRLPVLAGIAAALALAAAAMIWFDMSPARLIAGLRRLGWFAVLMVPPAPEGRFLAFSLALGETLAIAYLGTLISAILAFPFAFLAAKNVIPNIFIHFAARRVFDVIRSVDTLIWALIWINVVGLGPFAGVLAIASSDFGTFGKLFSEAIEAADGKAAEGIQAAGGSKPHQVRYGLMPQVLPVIASQVLYYFESNVRSATIIGLVGAGGVGIYLTELIRVLELKPLAFLIVMILVAVGCIDFASSKLRAAIIGRRPTHS